MSDPASRDVYDPESTTYSAWLVASYCFARSTACSIAPSLAALPSVGTSICSYIGRRFERPGLETVHGPRSLGGRRVRFGPGRRAVHVAPAVRVADRFAPEVEDGRLAR